MTFRPLPGLTLAALVSLAILVSFGAWQWARMEEKRAIFAAIAAEREAPPAPVRDVLAAPREYARVRIDALESRAVATWGPQGRVFQAARLPDGGAILVETARGGGAAPIARSFGPFSGVLRRIERAGPKNDPAEGVWLRPDAAMGEPLDAVVRPDWYVALDQLDDRTGPAVRVIDNPRADPRAAAIGPERHLGYAITWWGLAAALVGVYFVFHARMGRLSF